MQVQPVLRVPSVRLAPPVPRALPVSQAPLALRARWARLVLLVPKALLVWPGLLVRKVPSVKPVPLAHKVLPEVCLALRISLR